MSYCYKATDRDDYTPGVHDSIEDILEIAKEEGLKTVIIGEYNEYKQSNNSHFFPDAGHLLNHMSERAYDEAPDYVDKYPDCDEVAEKELTESLHKMLEQWCKKHDISPNFGIVENELTYCVESGEVNHNAVDLNEN